MVSDQLPLAAQTWQLQGTQWRLACAEKIALSSLLRLCARPIWRQGLIKMRAVQGVFRLIQKYCVVQLEAAYSPADHQGTRHYQAVKYILQKS